MAEAAASCRLELYGYAASQNGRAASPEYQPAPITGAPVLVPIGLGIFLVGGILSALLAARVLSPGDYTVYASFSSIWGIVVLAASGAIEQESAMRAAKGPLRSGSHMTALLQRAGVIWLVTTAILTVPVLKWQARLLGDRWCLWVGLAIAGSWFVFLSAILRGLGIGHGRNALVGSAYATTGLAMLGLTVALLAAGVSSFPAFLFGAVGAWLAGFIILAVSALLGRLDDHRTGIRATQEPPASATAWILAGNLLMTAAILVVPSVLRWHVASIGVDTVADAQLLVSLSRLVSTVILGLLPVMMARMVAGSGRDGGLEVARPWLVASLVMAVSAVLVLTVLGASLVSWITGRTASIDIEVILVAAFPVVFLAPALVLMALAAVRGRYSVTVAAWAASLAALIPAVVIDPEGQIVPLLLWVALGAFLPLMVFLWGLTRPRSASVV